MQKDTKKGEPGGEGSPTTIATAAPKGVALAKPPKHVPFNRDGECDLSRRDHLNRQLRHVYEEYKQAHVKASVADVDLEEAQLKLARGIASISQAFADAGIV